MPWNISGFTGKRGRMVFRLGARRSIAANFTGTMSSGAGEQNLARSGISIDISLAPNHFSY
jgi:hypothetical protein